MKITKEDVLKYLKKSGDKPLTSEELISGFKVSSKDREFFELLLEELIFSGETVRIKDGRLGIPEKMNLVVGKLKMNRKGSAFVIPVKEGKDDLFINMNKLGNAMHNDLVVARIETTSPGKKPEGVVVQVLKHFYKKIVGVFEEEGDHGWAIPEQKGFSHDIYIPGNEKHKALNGQVVVAEITKYPSLNRNPEGKIIKVLGSHHDRFIETKIAIEEYDIPQEFSDSAINEAETCSHPDIKYIVSRKNLQDLPTVTIDGENARDFDDAISIEKTENGNYKLWVHIADVAYYVKEESYLDKEAFFRGTSIYFPDYCVPMLPERLSNDICSLRPNESRLTVTAFMEFNPGGERISYELFESVIKSNERMTYENLKRIIIDSDEKLIERYSYLLDKFIIMKELCLLLKEKRWKRGSLDFDLPEPQFIIDATGQITSIIKSERNLAHQIIEEFMIAANETVASHLFLKNIPSLYRVHGKPDAEKITNFNEFIKDLKLDVKPIGKIVPKALQNLLNSVKGTSVEHMISSLLLRSLKHAFYSKDNIGHFGLASKIYTHFTSPIRRYPDLIVHRILKKLLSKSNLPSGVITGLEEKLPAIASHSSTREKVAEDAERKVLEIKKLEFLYEKKGEVFSGVISGVTSFGIFIEISELFIEGMVRLSSLKDDYYKFIEEKHCFKGGRKKNIYRLGDKVKVKVTEVDLKRREVNLVFVK
ncbi:MAG: ribonuclease R [Candidatus Schekmanbacteria bacterium RIFCSPHIGHO2_02_FULL_38_11]|uniref:Ribonuclease R n=1 Tax=Candidatus Schekmanbacteria bacterium RIFCSPLOWO2_12_FULL_38_15 TaxID=1817883 RepID=A0A1F7SL64_9BACT|nr:MAG: ribonuclease R [Candidatus Schekmanbacteria bacterium GWA2_38_9]OGL47995.1 MAG: ribonuclease R [Candidatus Schekmanbacteria bacterium RIFCSPLOWO2_02_FULL_38_14]OGL48433.1 MAG: ribonuclease R [Candidatus Schekmanbacteria bacterium RIFCSPHIGHO2_02_FULL_38_11]OGL54520.1 MAG: ribonuclease R [Candidatus Schekmanbacteria bacterium RIFCSPLOWO2_12_FULL_38_15]